MLFGLSSTEASQSQGRQAGPGREGNFSKRAKNPKVPETAQNRERTDNGNSRLFSSSEKWANEAT